MRKFQGLTAELENTEEIVEAQTNKIDELD